MAEEQAPVLDTLDGIRLDLETRLELSLAHSPPDLKGRQRIRARYEGRLALIAKLMDAERRGRLAGVLR
jgi:hypothetical protein